MHSVFYNISWRDTTCYSCIIYFIVQWLISDMWFEVYWFREKLEIAARKTSLGLIILGHIQMNWSNMLIFLDGENVTGQWDWTLTFVEQVVVCICMKELALLDDFVLSQVELVLVLHHWFNLREVIRIISLKLIVVLKNVGKGVFSAESYLEDMVRFLQV